MTSSLRVGDKVLIGFTSALRVADTKYDALRGTILGVDAYGIRLGTHEHGIHWLPWSVVGPSIVEEEGKPQGTQYR